MGGRSYMFYPGVHTITCSGDGWYTSATMMVKEGELWVILGTEIGEASSTCQLRLRHRDVASLVARGRSSFAFRGDLVVRGKPELAFDGEELLLFDREMRRDALRGRALRIPLEHWERFFGLDDLSGMLEGEGWDIKKFKGQQ